LHIKEKIWMRDWSERLAEWVPPKDWRRVVSVDAHTEGEPLRVIVGGYPELEGDSILAKRQDARVNHDGMRRALMWEPRGHADMYGCIVVPPVTPKADIGVLFTHNDGFSTMCGHGIIGVTTVLIEVGLAPDTAVTHGLGIDTPAGYVHSKPTIRNGRVECVSFLNVPSYLARADERVLVDGVGEVRYDLAYGGAFYAYVDASDFGLQLKAAEANQLIDLGRRIKNAVQKADPPTHPGGSDLGFVYGTIFVGDPHDSRHHSRNVCVFADGEIDRSPTGTGVSGRLAIHYARGQIRDDEEIIIESILGTCFRGRVVGSSRVGAHAAVIPEVTGSARITGRHEFLIDPTDPLWNGFVLR
jgi:proline racemase